MLRTAFLDFCKKARKKTWFFSISFNFEATQRCEEKSSRKTKKSELGFWSHISLEKNHYKQSRVFKTIFERKPLFSQKPELELFKVVKMKVYNGILKLRRAVKSFSAEIFPNPLAWWKTRPIRLIWTKVVFFENPSRRERVKTKICEFHILAPN